jgi:hypothetical protein
MSPVVLVMQDAGVLERLMGQATKVRPCDMTVMSVAAMSGIGLTAGAAAVVGCRPVCRRLSGGRVADRGLRVGGLDAPGRDVAGVGRRRDANFGVEAEVCKLLGRSGRGSDDVLARLASETVF